MNLQMMQICNELEEGSAVTEKMQDELLSLSEIHKSERETLQDENESLAAQLRDSIAAESCLTIENTSLLDQVTKLGGQVKEMTMTCALSRDELDRYNHSHYHPLIL